MAKERGLCPGCTVTLMDSNDRGILRHVHKDCVEIEIDGLLFKAGFGDFVVNDAEEDSRLVSSVGGGQKRKEQGSDRPQPLPNEISVDLLLDSRPCRCNDSNHKMKAYTYMDKGRFALMEKPEPKILEPKDAIVKVTLASICTSDLHIKHGSVPRAVPGITVGHEMAGIVTEVGE